MKLKRRFGKALSLFLAAAMTVNSGAMLPAAASEEVTLDTEWEETILDDEDNQQESSDDSAVMVDDMEESSSESTDGEKAVSDNDEATIEILDVETVTYNGTEWFGQELAAETMPLNSGEELKEAPEVKGGRVSEGFYDFLAITILQDSGYINEITEISVNGSKWEKVSSKMSVYGSGKYYLETDGNQIYFDASSGGVFSEEDKITITSEGYKDLVLEVTGTGSDFAVEAVKTESDTNPDTEPDSEPDTDPEPEETKEAPEVEGGRVSEGFYDFLAITILQDSEYINKITGISVNGTEWTEVSSKMSVYGSGKYYLETDGNQIYFDASSGGVFNEEDKITITSEGYKDLVLKVTGTGSDFAVEAVKTELDTNPDTEPDSDPEPEETKKAPKASGEKITDNLSDFLAVTVDDLEYISGITAISVKQLNTEETIWNEATATIALCGSGSYYLNSDESRIYFDGTGEGVLFTGDIITIKNPDYEDLVLLVTGDGDAFAVKPYDESASIGGPSDGVNTLHVRLVGSFEAAITGQEGYDAVSGASTSVTTNKNSNVEVQAAVLPNGTEPTEDDWKPLHETGLRVNTEKTTVNINAESSGMVGIYSTYDSSLTLSGTPDQPGEYSISVTVTDKHGRTATSNALTFKVYSGSEKLIDCLTLENSTQTADGKYMYDMEPWAIEKFGGDDETVTVPEDIKAWYGSHTSGTYGELGYAVSGNPVQTLIVPAGCDLTLVNMKILSSVKIVVENGGILRLNDSSIHGQIEVKDGGVFSMNYDAYTGEFQTGSSINGQLILDNGAVLESSLIYSNTNYLPNGTEARHNVSPVVVVNGNVTISGEVYIRGDEAPSGTDSGTGKSYSGQPALKVENGTLTIPEGSVLAVYGGGNSALTSVGGDALILSNAEVTGGGKLIAVGGSGEYDDGGNAVSGNGTISVGSAYLEGGSSYFPKDGVTAGKSAAETVAISGTAKIVQVEGQLVTSNSDSVVSQYWSGTAKPDISFFDEVMKDQESESGNDQESESGNDQESETGNRQESESGNDQESETGNRQESETGNNQGGAAGDNQESETGNNPADSVTQPGTDTVQPGETEVKAAASEAQQDFTVVLSKTSYVYNGKAKKPKVTVSIAGTVLDASFYTVVYRNNKKAGIATVTVTGTGTYEKYSGTATFRIRPKKTKVSSVKSSKKKKITVKWKKNKQASGYEISVCRNKKFKTNVLTYTVSGKKKTSATISKGLKSGKKYYVRIRAYKTSNGTKVYSKWSAKKQVTVK